MFKDEVYRITHDKNEDRPKLLPLSLREVLPSLIKELDEQELSWVLSYSNFPEKVLVFVSSDAPIKGKVSASYRISLLERNQATEITFTKIEEPLFIDVIDQSILIDELTKCQESKGRLKIIGEILFNVFDNNITNKHQFVISAELLSQLNELLNSHNHPKKYICCMKKGDNWLDMANNPKKVLFYIKPKNSNCETTCLFADGSIQSH